MVGLLAELLRDVALILSAPAGGSQLPAVTVVGALISAALIVAVMLCASVRTANGPVLTAHVASEAEVLVRLRQSNPDAAGHSRSRAPAHGG